MKVLVACEESQEVCKAFRALGHEAYSCDIQEPSGGHPEWHILGDAVDVVNRPSIAQDILDEECRASRPLIKKRVEQIINEYNFPQLERDEIMYTIADVLTDRLLPEKEVE